MLVLVAFFANPLVQRALTHAAGWLLANAILVAYGPISRLLARRIAMLTNWAANAIPTPTPDTNTES